MKQKMKKEQKGGLVDNGNNSEHRWISSHSVQSTGTVYPLAVNEVVVPDPNTSVEYRHVNHVVIEEPVVPLHDINYDRVHVPSRHAIPSVPRVSANLEVTLCATGIGNHI